MPITFYKQLTFPQIIIPSFDSEANERERMDEMGSGRRGGAKGDRKRG